MNETPPIRPDIAAARLSPAELDRNFADIHPALSPHDAAVEADRCYFCYDAPCMDACPTGIDIPLFIREIQAGNPLGAARTIFSQNILGGMCARVCPTEELCEGACVRQAAEERPVRIGLLQRHATDTMMATGRQPFARAAPTGRHVAVVGAGPAGLSCAHRLAILGHSVTLYDARSKPGGLNEFGIASYKAVDDFAQREVDYLVSVGGISLQTGTALGRDISLEALSATHDAVFLGIGLAGVNALGVDGEGAPDCRDAVDWIATLRQAGDLGALPIGRRVVVIGGGMTAVDAAVQARALGAEEVTLAYRRGRDAMNASLYEQELAARRGVRILCHVQPRRVLSHGGVVQGIELERTREEGGRLIGTGATLTLEADQIFKAIGQTLLAAPQDGAGLPALEAGRIRVDAELRTSMPGIWAGGDCIAGGLDLTVAAVEDGKRAAMSIHAALLRERP